MFLVHGVVGDVLDGKVFKNICGTLKHECLYYDAVMKIL